ncbi:hypothetical protein [Prosthecobacter sp.]|uniref:hypothetical protein n=1 Tax=Prosthecobacter sp. TaxID=1965333 RepID=UPI003783DF9C
MLVRLLAKFIVAAMALSATSWARVGETMDECTSSYGKPIFKHDKGDFGFRIFDFANRTAKVYFYHDRSVMEVVCSKIIKYRSKDEGNELMNREFNFYLRLLKDSYGFLESDLEDAKDLEPNKSHVLESSVSHGLLTARFEVEINYEEQSAKVTVAVRGGEEIKAAMKNELFAKAYSDFSIEAEKAADKFSKQKRVQGFQ